MRSELTYSEFDAGLQRNLPLRSYTQFIVSMVAEPPPEPVEFELTHPEILTTLSCLPTEADRYCFLLLVKTPLPLVEVEPFLRSAHWQLPNRAVRVEVAEPELGRCAELFWDGTALQGTKPRQRH